MERPSAISEHLKVVEVKYDVVNKRIAKILKFLCAFSAFDIHKLTSDSLRAFYILKLA